MPPTRSPQKIKNKLELIIGAWETLAASKSFGGLTLAQFKAAVQPSFDLREELHALEMQVEATQVARDTADAESLRTIERVVNGVIGDPTAGPDSDLYEAMGYVRKSARKSGLTRKKPPAGSNT